MLNHLLKKLHKTLLFPQLSKKGSPGVSIQG